MSIENPNLPLPLGATPDLSDGEFAPLLSEPFARVWQAPTELRTGAATLRTRLLARTAASGAAEAGMVTSRRRRIVGNALADGVTAQTLYRAQPGRAPRPGEPLQARLIQLAAGALLDPVHCGGPAWNASHREWLVLSGGVQCGREWLSQRDYHVTPAGHEAPAWRSTEGALLFLRESGQAAAPGDQPFTVRDAEAGWPAFASGIQRRVLWHGGGQAALLYFAQPGAQVPQHVHGHDEECLMLQGELFLDDVLLQTGDYQLAPAGTGHRVTQTDTGVVIYAHGDLDLRFV